MKIGKTVKIVTSPPRRACKVGEKPQRDNEPIPIKLPNKKKEKVPAEV